MKKNSFKGLDEILGDNSERVALSTRVKKETKSILSKEAKARDLTVSTLAAAILDDYIETLQNKKKG
jgi:hypothetical protein